MAWLIWLEAAAPANESAWSREPVATGCGDRSRGPFPFGGRHLVLVRSENPAQIAQDSGRSLEEADVYTTKSSI